MVTIHSSLADFEQQAYRKILAKPHMDFADTDAQNQVIATLYQEALSGYASDSLSTWVFHSSSNENLVCYC